MAHPQTPRPLSPVNPFLSKTSSSRLYSSRSYHAPHELALSRRLGRRLALNRSGKRAHGQRSANRESGDELLPISNVSRFSDSESNPVSRSASRWQRWRLLRNEGWVVLGAWLWLHRVAGSICFSGSFVCYVKRWQASMHMNFKGKRCEGSTCDETPTSLWMQVINNVSSPVKVLIL